MSTSTYHRRCYFGTLGEALDSEGLVDLWPNRAVAYGETVRVVVDDGSRHGRLISVYRDNEGRYERPITYAC